jgi:predicted MFS family arabinose efflux permease
VPSELKRAPSIGSGAYLLFLVALICVSLEADRTLFSVAIEPIKHEFHLSDSQLGAINGLAFVVFFGIAGIPIARLAERKGRKPVIVASVAVWSAFTALTAFGVGFLSLFAIRIMVGIGESGCNPALQSLIAARFAPQQRSGAMSVMVAGIYFGILLGLALGGVLIEALGWRNAFLLMGASGAIVTPLVWATLKDAPLSRPAATQTLLRELFEILRAGGMLHYLAMCCLMGLTTYATIAWAPSFYARYYGMNAAQVGVWVGFIFGGGAFVGSLLGGMIVNRLNRRRKDAALSFMIWTTIAFTPPSIIAFLVESRWQSMAYLFASVVLGGLAAGPIYATLHDLVEPRQRSVAAALVTLAYTIVGWGVGPYLVGVISDSVGASHAGLRVGLVVINLFNIWTLWHMYRLLATYRRRFVTATSS